MGRLPGGPLGAGAPGRTPRLLLQRTRRAPHGLAGSRRPAHPPGDAGAGSPRRHCAGGPDRSRQGNRVPGRGPGRRLGPGPGTGNFFLDHNYEDGSYDGFADPWEEEIIQDATREWQQASALLDSALGLADWLEGDLPSRFDEMLDFILPRLPIQEQLQQQEESDDDQ